MRRKGITIIETAVVGVIAVVAGSVTVGGLSSKSSKAETAKCLNNLKRSMTAIQLYCGDHAGILPGPVHMAVAQWDPDPRVTRDRKKTIAWHLRPYFETYGSDVTNPDHPDPVTDKVFTCPTIKPDHYSDLVKRFTYVVNTSGPYSYTCDPEWYHTDPPNYFGIWYYLDHYPINEDGSYVNNIYHQRSWRPKTIESIPNSSSEWAIGDAWSRQISSSVSRPGTPETREALGTFPQSCMPQTPVAPPHEAPVVEYAGKERPDVYQTYSLIDFTGKTNLGYFDGHANSFSGNWLEAGHGGTVNPYWEEYGGTHTEWDPTEYE